MDSALCLARYGAELAIGFDYGQPHAIELRYAKRIADNFHVPFDSIELQNMPMIDDVVFAGRNAVMLSTAASIAQSIGIDTVVIGCNASDAHRFPDCRPEFIASIGAALSAYGVSVSAPLIGTTKAQIVAEARAIGLPETWTCYAPTSDGCPCGVCLSCRGITCSI